MKKFFKFSVYAILLVGTLILTSCQEEFEELPQPDEEQTIMASSSTAKLIEHTTSNDGSYDNIVDGASCLSVRFPYTVNVNGIDIAIDSREDLQLIEEIVDELEAGDDILDILFPITVILADYTEIVIDGKEDLRALAEECTEGGDDDDIECIDFVYPITLYTFDLNNQQTGSVVVNSDQDLRRFFAGLDDNDLISIDFPITLILHDGTEVQANNNAELAHALELAKEACDEDDDNDHNDDDFTQERLENLLVECPWLVHEVERDGIDQTDQYFEFLMDFKENGEVTVKDRMGNSLTGEWSTRVADHKILVKLEFDVLVDFNLEWYVYELGKGTIKFFSEGGNKIVMKRICDQINTPPDTLREILKECSWVIAKVKNQGEEVDRLLGYEFKFLAEGVVTLSNGVTTSEGSWEINANAQGRLVMAISMGSEPAINFEWPLSDLKNDRLKFEAKDIGYELVLQRVCEDNAGDGDVGEIRNILMAGEWVVAQYTNSGEEEADDYSAYTFDFQAGYLLGITAGETGPTYAGLWRVLRNSDGKLKVYLNGGETEPLDELSDDWDFVSVNEERLELKASSENEAGMNMLVFEKK